MKVKELIAELKKCDPDLRVLVCPPDDCCPNFDNDLYNCCQEVLIRDRDNFAEKVVSLYYENTDEIDEDDDY